MGGLGGHGLWGLPPWETPMESCLAAGKRLCSSLPASQIQHVDEPHQARGRTTWPCSVAGSSARSFSLQGGPRELGKRGACKPHPHPWPQDPRSLPGNEALDQHSPQGRLKRPPPEQVPWRPGVGQQIEAFRKCLWCKHSLNLEKALADGLVPWSPEPRAEQAPPTMKKGPPSPGWSHFRVVG